MWTKNFPERIKCDCHHSGHDDDDDKYYEEEEENNDDDDKTADLFRASVEQTLILQYIRPGHISPSLHARDDQDYEHDDGDEKCYNIKITMMAIIAVAHMVIFSWSELWTLTSLWIFHQST